jgi:hypothetical protein
VEGAGSFATVFARRLPTPTSPEVAMDEDRDVKSPRVDSGGSDYEYDLAHEAGTSAPVQTQKQRQHLSVETQPDDGGGDYGYDMAHDMRPS